LIEGLMARLKKVEYPEEDPAELPIRYLFTFVYFFKINN